uniref:Guanylate cyclase domain-containing protein n=1 Tax=Ditylum brightwellii TaxID=49249 RepID=A0A7S4QHH6_9STRA
MAAHDPTLSDIAGLEIVTKTSHNRHGSCRTVGTASSSMTVTATIPHGLELGNAEENGWHTNPSDFPVRKASCGDEGFRDEDDLSALSWNKENSNRSIKIPDPNNRVGSIADNNSVDFSPPFAEEITRESRAISKLKIIVISALVITAVTVSTLAFHFNREDENEDFKMQYYNFASKISESFQQQIDTMVFNAMTMSSMITSHRMNSPWPNVTLEDFQVLTTGNRLVSHLLAVSFSPLVTQETKLSWENYAVQEAKNRANAPRLTNRSSAHARVVADGIYKIEQDEWEEDGLIRFVDDDEASPSDFYLPIWQIAPMKGNEAAVMFNQRSNSKYKYAIDTMIERKCVVLSDISYMEPDFRHHGSSNGHEDGHFHEPISSLFYPISSDFSTSGGGILGAISFWFSWESTLTSTVPDNVEGLCLVVETPTGQQFTFRTAESGVVFEGIGDLHESRYDQMEVTATYIWCHPDDSSENDDHDHSHDPNVRGECKQPFDSGYKLKIYPTSAYNSTYLTKGPVTTAAFAALIFLFTTVTFLTYDCLVERRQTTVMKSAARSDRILHSLYPKFIRDRLYKNSEKEEEECMGEHTLANLFQSATVRLRNHLSVPKENSGGELATLIHPSPPIADLFTDTTVLVANIAGFTAWSSEREPTQVFQLLEVLYSEFDSEARKQGVFKVETNGDNYVAVVGLPDPRYDHALVMAQFAQRCLGRFRDLMKELELSLGPGTAKLGMRIGMHSGPVTAGVLRGERQRFQLFGDTISTARQLESTGVRNKVQISQETAELLKTAGLINTLSPREEVISVTGKGQLQTYWLHTNFPTKNTDVSFYDTDTFFEVGKASTPTIYEMQPSLHEAPKTARRNFLSDMKSLRAKSLKGEREKKELTPWTSWHSWSSISVANDSTEEELERLITWNASVLETHLQKILSQRKESKRTRRNSKTLSLVSTPPIPYIDELSEAVAMPSFNRDAVNRIMNQGYKMTPLPEKVRTELHNYVTRIAALYRGVNFHNFEHASHVTMSANKLMNKVCSPMLFNGNKKNEKKENKGGNTTKAQEADFFFSTYGIGLDPLAQFAIVFAALIHDVDHTGIPNFELIKENADLGSQYKNRTVAEQNSIHIALSILMEPKFENLRLCIYTDEESKQRFRQLLINVVVATDIADRDRMGKEKARWERAFADVSSSEELWQNKSDEELAQIDVSLKATLVLEQIMLASDVAHTMQHWLTFVKWNEKLFRELWAAYSSGRGTIDPRINWYQGQISFYDGYIIPLAKKLKECGVFGSAGEEYLSFALKNREEWTEKGEEISAQFIQSITMSGA